MIVAILVISIINLVCVLALAGIFISKRLLAWVKTKLSENAGDGTGKRLGADVARQDKKKDEAPMLWQKWMVARGDVDDRS